MAKKMKLFVDENIAYAKFFFKDVLLKEFPNFFELIFYKDDNFDLEKISEDAAVIIRSTYKTHNLKVPNSIKLLSSVSTGEDHVDKHFLEEKNIPYHFATGANAKAVREYFYSCLSILLKEKKFDKSKDKILIIGLGNIGHGIAETLKKLNFSFETYDPFKTSTIKNLSNLKDFKIITLHVPLTKNLPHETYNFVDKNFLNELKNESIIINTSRGGVLSESDFLKFDNLEVISDVFLNEPNIDKSFLQKNFISTPHIAGHTKSSRFEMTKMSLEKLIHFFFNEKLNNSLVMKPYKKKSIHFSISEVEDDLRRYGFPVSLLLQIYDPRNDKFNLSDFTDVRNAYQHRLGYEDITSNNHLNVSEYLFELGIE
jgi:erythronate-4-phosphate dehydrogenase